jgi:drug/metabolite transporter (DMT)-like permease
MRGATSNERFGFAPYLSALGAIVCWASLAGALYRSLGTLQPQQVLAYGMGLAGLVLLAWDWVRGRAPWKTWPGLRGLGPGLYGIFGYHALLVLAFDLAPQIEANILNYTWPLWILLLGTPASGGRLSPRVLAGGLIGLAGAALALEPWAAQSGSAAASGGVKAVSWAIVGYGLALAAGFCWGSFTVWLRKHCSSAEPPLGWWCLLAATVAALWMAVSGVSIIPDPASLPALLYIGLVPWGAAFPLWAYASRRAALPLLGLLSYVTPPMSTLLLGWVAQRSPTIWAWIGLAIVLIGAALGSGQHLPLFRVQTGPK